VSDGRVAWDDHSFIAKWFPESSDHAEELGNGRVGDDPVEGNHGRGRRRGTKSIASQNRSSADEARRLAVV